MQTFKIRKDGFKEIKKQMLIRVAPIMLIVVIAAIVIVSTNSRDKTAEVNALPIIIPLMVALVGFSLNRGVNRQKSLFESFTLTIANNLVTREQLNTPTISIYFNDIKEIVKHKNGSFTIRGKEAVDLIGIPAQIDDYSQLETALHQIQPLIVKDKSPFFEKYQSLTVLVTIGLMLCVYTVNNKIIVGLTGTALVVLMVWGFVKIHSSKNVDNKTKRIVWWGVFVLLSVIAVMIFKLTDLADAALLSPAR